MTLDRVKRSTTFGMKCFQYSKSPMDEAKQEQTVYFKRKSMSQTRSGSVWGRYDSCLRHRCLSPGTTSMEWKRTPQDIHFLIYIYHRLQHRRQQRRQRRSEHRSELTTAVIRVPDPCDLTEASASLLASSLIGSVASFVHLSTLPLRS